MTGRAGADILHVDMDAFYAAVEVLHDPSLAGRPLIVGGAGRRGVVAAASYEARAYGVRSAMPSTQARRLCPHAVFVSGRYDRYTSYSERIHEIFAAFTPLVEGIALDEAFLDVRGSKRLFGTGAEIGTEIGTEIRRRIRAELGLSASVGVAASKFVAKLASEEAKPRASLAGVIPGRGVVVVAPGSELAFLHPKPVEALWGVGPATSARLRRLGVATIGDLAAVPLETLELTIGSANGRHLHDLAWGRDDRQVEADRELKSVGHEETYAHDKDDRDELHREIVRMADAVASRLRAAEVAGRTITLKVRFGDFVTITRSQTVSSPVDAGPALARVGSALLEQVDVLPGVRLLGISASNLSRGAARQLSLDLNGGGDASAAAHASEVPDAPNGVVAGASKGGLTHTSGPDDAAWEEATRAVDQVRKRFGDRSLGPAVLLGEDGLRVKRQGDTQWGPPGRPVDECRGPEDHPK